MEQLIKETQTYYDRILNTYHYSIQSDRCDIEAETQRFSFTIPPFPFPQHQGSQVGILRIKSFHICNEGPLSADRISRDVAFDIPSFYLRLKGFGLRPQLFANNTTAGAIGSLKNQMDIPVINEFAQCENATDGNQRTEMPMVAGSSNIIYEMPVSNPAGTTCIVEVFEGPLNQLVTDDDYFSLLQFSIELIPTEISNGR